MKKEKGQYEFSALEKDQTGGERRRITWLPGADYECRVRRRKIL